MGETMKRVQERIHRVVCDACGSDLSTPSVMDAVYRKQREIATLRLANKRLKGWLSYWKQQMTPPQSLRDVLEVKEIDAARAGKSAPSAKTGRRR